MKRITLENQSLRLSFGLTNGALVGFEALNTGWNMLGGRVPAAPFQLMVPLPGRRNNPVRGEKQHLSQMMRAVDGTSLELAWDGLEPDWGGLLDIALRMTVRLVGASAEFALTIENRSPYRVESVCYPVFADFRPPEESAWLKGFCFNYAGAKEWNVWPRYDNQLGYYGFDTPVQSSAGSPTVPFALYHDSRQGLYMGTHGQGYETVAWMSELWPGYSDSMDRQVPNGDEIVGKPAAIRIFAAQLPYVAPGETRTLMPLTLAAYQGNWQEGADIYTQWRSSWITPREVPEWAREVHSWQQIHINSPEDELRVRFTDLIEIGRSCAKHGVKAIQLVGWNDGGQDQGNPSHDPDPRLGTFEELRQAIADIQALGVKVILFTKFTWADRATERFRKELIDCAIKDPYGDYYVHNGYQYQTVAQELNVNTKRLIPMCFLDERYMKVCEEEFKKVVALGADGMLFDECQHHAHALCCFDETHGHRYGAPVYAADNALIKRLRKLAPPEFFMAGEALHDRLYQEYHLSYFRSEDRAHIPMTRYLQPRAQAMTAVTGFDDRNMIGQCLMYRYIVSYEPYNFKGRLDDFPLTMEYGKKMDALRCELCDYFWEGEFLGTRGARVVDALSGDAVDEPYAVYLRRDGQALGMVICNYGDNTVKLRIILENGRDLHRCRLIDDPEWKPADTVVIPPRSAAVVV